ncbi:hypothetical protein N2152v2_004954 [Parachlorella kessleri]
MDLGQPGDWAFKGEGNANVVFGYTGSRSDLVGRVLKVRKSLRRACSVGKTAQQELENDVWAPVLGQHQASPLALELIYTEQCLMPLLGSEYVPSQIKPKCGYVTASPAIHPDNHIKQTRSRYQLHQLLKVAEGKLAAASSYDPLDLFSNQPQRMLAALRALFAHPQNNLRLFFGGAPVGLQEGLSKWAAVGHDPATVDNATAAATEATDAEPDAGLEELLKVLVQILLLEGVLNRLLSAQQHCEVDIEGIFALYCKLLSRVSSAQQATTEDSSTSLGSSQLLATHHQGVQEVLSLPTSEAYSLLRRYVVSATAKDCALMISLRRLASATEGRELQQRGGKVVCSTSDVLASCVEGLNHAVVLEDSVSSSGQQWYQYQVAFVDLDMKALAKIPQHFELDQRIVKVAREQQENQQQLRIDG